MKFEKLSVKKFEEFKVASIANANAIIGGKGDTDRSGTGTHDTAGTTSAPSWDNVRKTKDGQSDDSSGDPV